MELQVNHKVSIIITVYNYAEYVAQAIQSALDQSYANKEVVVINDGSTDNSSEAIKPFLEQVTYIEQENQGVVAARNNGAAASSGEYLLFLDADDYLSADYLEHAVKVLDENPQVAFVYGDINVFGKKVYKISGREWNVNSLLLTNYIGLVSLMRKKAFEEVGGFSHDMNKKKSYEDWDFWLTLADFEYQGKYDNRLQFNYRKLNQANRNKAGLFAKIQLRLPLVLRHKRLYCRVANLVLLPKEVIALSLRKIKLLRMQSPH